MSVEGVVEELTVGELPEGLQRSLASSTAGADIAHNPESSFYRKAVLRHRLDYFTAYNVVNGPEVAIRRHLEGEDDRFVTYSDPGGNILGENVVQDYLLNLADGMGSWEAQRKSYTDTSSNFVSRFDSMFPDRGRDEPLLPEEQEEIRIISENYFDF